MASLLPRGQLACCVEGGGGEREVTSQMPKGQLTCCAGAGGGRGWRGRGDESTAERSACLLHGGGGDYRYSILNFLMKQVVWRRRTVRSWVYESLQKQHT